MGYCIDSTTTTTIMMPPKRVVICFLSVASFSFAVASSSRLLHYPLQKVSHRRNLQSDRVFDENEDHDGLFRGYGTHYANIYVGCPPQLQTVIIDTGSSTTGFPCSKCEGCGEGYQLNPVFRESESTCFAPVSCDECPCQNDECRTSVYYAEGSGWSGTGSRDLTRIGTVDEDPFVLLFACQDVITGLFKTQLADGIMGLSRGNGSTWNQLYYQKKIDKPQFSLCLQKDVDTRSGSGVMVFGGTDARLHRSEMRFAKELQSPSEFWELRIRKIVAAPAGAGVGDDNWKEVSTDTISESTLNPIVDSGSTSTYMDRALEGPMREAWEAVTSLEFGVDHDSIEELPTFWFQFEGADDNASTTGATVDPENPKDILIPFPPSSYMHKKSWSIYWTPDPQMVLGANFMNGHDVLFDNENHRIGFAESDCVLDGETLSEPGTIEVVSSPGVSPAVAAPSSAIGEDATETGPDAMFSSDAATFHFFPLALGFLIFLASSQLM